MKNKYLKEKEREIRFDKLGLIVILLSLYSALEFDVIGIGEIIFVMISFIIGISLYLVPSFFSSY